MRRAIILVVTIWSHHILVAFGRILTELAVHATGELPALTDDSTCRDWAAWIPPAATGGGGSNHPEVLVMQVVSKDYIDVERNFIKLMEENSSLTRQSLYLMCLDDESVEYFEKSMGIRCLPLSGVDVHKSHGKLWLLRVRVVSCLVNAGQSVIMSDSDALWLHDPMQDLAQPGDISESSIVASRGAYPAGLGWGSTMCMGFIMFRAASGTREDTVSAISEFLALMSDHMLIKSDDQVAANMAASKLGIVWDKNSDMNYLGSTGIGVGTISSLPPDDQGRPFKVTLLPHSKYTRVCARTPVSGETVVAHCRSVKSAFGKLAWMKEGGFWEIDDEGIPGA